MEKNKKQALILSIVAVVTLIALVVGATFAYFKAQGGTGSSTEVKVTTYTTDMLTFTTGNAISLYADQSSFGQKKGSLSGETFAKATLVANNKTNEATDNYYVYFNIENNTFKYTLGEDKPELILTVTGPDGNEVTSLPGLTHKVVQDRENKSISGFDVTTTNGLITIANKKTITATTDAKEEQYTLKLTFVNYEGDQTENATSTLSAKVMIQKELIPQVVSDVCGNGENLATCITTLAGKSSSSITKIYHYDGTMKSDSEFSIGYYDAGIGKYVQNTYPAGTALDANDNSYRYAGASEEANNYVCFGSTQSPCPADNLYRIIGVFGDKVKLIKSTSVGDKAWDSSNANDGYGSNTWSTSSLNTYLNNEFITTFDETTKGKIEKTTWKVGGNTFNNIVYQSASTAYQNEIVSPVTTYATDNATTYSAKVGLMYVSDYMYAAPQDKWTLVGYNSDVSKDYRAATSVNWMYLGSYEWTISRNADNSGNAFSVANTGYVLNSGAFNALAVRPVFYLSSSVTYVEGDGTQSLPIRVN